MMTDEPECFGNFFPDPNCYACLCHEECEAALDAEPGERDDYCKPAPQSSRMVRGKVKYVDEPPMRPLDAEPGGGEEG